jgi:heptosyltransferase-1
MVPEAEIDWAVEDAYAAIPKLHPGVSAVVPVALRRWRRTLLARDTRAEIVAFVRRLRGTRYDAIVDTQGLLKSALVARAARGRRYGLDWMASREPLFLFYDQTFDMPRAQHAVERNRNLAARVFRYAVPAATHYGISAPSVPHLWLPPGDHAVLVHATSGAPKLWPEEEWVAVGKALGRRGIRAVLPWGTEEERRRSERLVAAIPAAVAPPRLELPALASLLAQARCAVGVDTGLTHLAGALGVATIGIFTATDPAATGLHGCARALNVGGAGIPPSAEDVMQGLQRLAP